MDLVGQFLRLAGHIPVYAQRGREAFDAAVELLRDGETVGIFPEGALTEEYGHLMPTHTGAVRLAATARVPLLPMGIALDRHFVASSTINQFGVREKMCWYKTGAYEVTFGEPLLFSHSPDDREAVQESTMCLAQLIESLMEQSAKRLLAESWPLSTSMG